ncbi:transcriptional regulator protein [Arthrobacter sp. Hiyo4]|nr:transcriptional regulator protein [Arthrobacter sp. Hiyo4]
MTTGIGMPEEEEQSSWLLRLIQVGVSGLIVAPHPNAPTVTPAMIQTADEHKFPLLKAPFELEFVTLARVIIKNSLDIERERLEKAKRIFDAYGDSLSREAGGLGRLEAIARGVGWDLALVDDTSGDVIATSGRRRDARATEQQSTVLAIPGRLRMSLRIRTEPNTVPDALLAHYVVGITALELEQYARSLDERRRDGETVLRSLLKGAVEIRAISSVLEQHKIAGDIVLLSIMAEDGGAYSLSNVHLAPALRSPEVLLLQEDGEFFALAPDDDDVIETFAKLLGSDTRIGVSLPLSPVVGVPEARRQAHLALQDAVEAPRPCAGTGGRTKSRDTFHAALQSPGRWFRKFSARSLTMIKRAAGACWKPWKHSSQRIAHTSRARSNSVSTDRPSFTG